MKPTWLAILLVLFGNRVWCQASPSVDLTTEARLHVTSSVGYTLVADNYGMPVHDASLSERAMVVNLDTGRSFEILPALRAVPRATSVFTGWLPGHIFPQPESLIAHGEPQVHGSSQRHSHAHRTLGARSTSVTPRRQSVLSTSPTNTCSTMRSRRVECVKLRSSAAMRPPVIVNDNVLYHS